MTILEQKPLTLSIPLREEPQGVLRVGKSRVLLELVIHAHQRGASAQEIVRLARAARPVWIARPFACHRPRRA